MKKVAIYKVLIGEYEYLHDEIFQVTKDSNDIYFDYFFLSDKKIDIPAPWNLIVIDRKFKSPAVENRYYKIQVPNELDIYDYTIYLDTNISIRKNIGTLMQKIISEENYIYAYPHFRNTTIKEEVTNCFIFSRIKYIEMRNAIKFFSDDLNSFVGFECGVLIRKKQDGVLKTFQETWFDFYVNNVKRDQLYFMLSLKKYGVDCHKLAGDPLRSETGYFKLHPHREKVNFIKKITIAIKMRLYRYKRSDI